jgi:tetratricopeptide (TPR) repeat protein
VSQYRIFLSSPKDVSAERDRAQLVIDRLNAEHPGEPLFSLTRWEHDYFTAQEGFQTQISAPGRGPGDHDLVVFIFWKRLGTDLPPQYNRVDGTTRTGTEYEFEEARDARERRADQLPDILVYRKRAKVLYSEETLDAERAQKKALDQFWERWFRTDVGHFIAGFQSFQDLTDFERQLTRHLREWLQRRRTDKIVWEIERLGSPYRGLEAYDETHAGLFFGRDNDIAQARARFIEASIGRESGRRGLPFLLILGPSGSGKSSFLRAGLLPRMRTGGAPAFREDGADGIHAFRSLVVVPRELGEDLCRGLATALYRAREEQGHGLPELADGDYRTADAFAELASSSPTSAVAPVLGALDRLSTVTEPGIDAGSRTRWGLMLAIDQLEELFALPDPARRAFVDLLSALAASGRVWVAATMRNDFYDRLRQDPELGALTDKGRTYDLSFPVAADYRAIIRHPAEAAGLRFEATARRDLAVELESEATGEGVLPMVAFLLDQLFRQRRGNLLTLETYDRLGGAAGAMAHHGEQVFATLPAAVADSLRHVSRRLVRKSLQDTAATSTAAPLSAFPAGSPHRQLVDALSSARLLTAFTVPTNAAEDRAAWVRWTHESLLDRWPRLRQLIDADRRDYETLDRLRAALALYDKAAVDQRAPRLLSGLSLAEGLDLIERWGSDVDPSLQRYVADSESARQARERRRRRTVATVITSLSGLTLIAVAAGLLFVRERNAANRQATIASRTADFMVSLFEQADPTENRGKPLTAHEMLDRGAQDIGHNRMLDPGIRADLMTAMGRAYDGLGLFEPAKDLLEQARQEQRSGVVSDESRVRTLLALGTTLYFAADYDQAEKISLQAVDLARRSLPSSSVLRSQTLTGLADVLTQLERYPEAEKLCLEALSADRKRGAAEAGELANTLDSLANVYLDSGDLQRAEAPMREALSLRLKAFGEQHTRTAQSMNNLALLLYQMGRYDEASTLFRQALPIYRALYTGDHPEVADILNNLGRSALMAGDLDEAEALLRESIAIDDRIEPPTHDDFVPTLNSLAEIHSFRGQLAEARKEIDRALSIAQLPGHGAFLSLVQMTCAYVDLAEARNLDAAAALLTDSHGLLEQEYPLNKNAAAAWRYAVWDSVDARLLAARGESTRARQLLTASVPVIEQRFGASGFYSQRARKILASLALK